MIKRVLLAVLFFMVGSVYCFAENFPMQHFTVNEGLPSNTIYYVYRDAKGFIWIATDKGIARYNGIKFEIFTTANGMPDNEIFNMQEDKFGRLWFSTFNGKLCFYKDGRFHNAKNTPYLRLPFRSTQIMKIIPEQDSTVTIMFENREKFVNIGNNNISIVYLKDDTDISRLFFVTKADKTNYRFYYQNCVKIVSSQHALVSRSNLLSKYKNEPCTAWDVLNSQDNMYIVNEHYIYNQRFEVIKVLPEKLHINNWKLHAIYFDTSNVLFRNTDHGVVCNDINILSEYSTPSITQDLLANYWIATLHDGIFVLPNKYKQSKQYPDAYTGNIRYAYADNSILFFNNSENNLYQMKADSLTCILNYEKLKKKYGEFANNHGYLVMKDGATGHYNYLNYYNNFIIYLTDLCDKRNLFFVRRPFNPVEIVKSVTDVQDNIYIRTIKKIYRNKLSDYTTPESLSEKALLVSDNADRIFAFSKNNKNEVWFSDNVNGVYKIKDDRVAFQKQFKDITFNKFEFFGDYLVGYTLDENLLLICSNLDGTPDVDTITNQNCIWDRFYKIDKNHLLITTNNLCRVFTLVNTGSKQSYTLKALENPLIPSSIETICSDGTNCFFFSDGSITKITVDQLLEEPRVPQLFYNYIKYGTKRFLVKDELSLPYKSSENVSISFSTLSFTGKNIIYQYSVSKTNDDKWEIINSENINFIVPGYGKYIIKIRARSIAGNYSLPKEFVLFITPPFWATWWFGTLCAIAATSLVAAVVRYRLLWILKKNEKENENKIRFMKSEYKALNALMNPHFIFNTLNNVQGLVNRNDKLAANEYLRIFADLVRQNMHNVSKEMIPLQKEIDLVANYLALEKLRFKEFLNYSVDVEDEVDTSVIMVPPLLIQPLVENSIKHGIFPKQSTDSCVQLNVYERDDVLFIEVKDNGVGMNFAKTKVNPNHESFGLQNIRNRIDQLSVITGRKMEFTIQELTDENDKWTVVTIRMPL